MLFKINYLFLSIENYLFLIDIAYKQKLYKSFKLLIFII